MPVTEQNGNERWTRSRAVPSLARSILLIAESGNVFSLWRVARPRDD